MGQMLASCDRTDRPGRTQTSPAVTLSTRTVPLREGDAGTAQTIRLVRRAVLTALVSPEVRETAARILQTVPAFDDRAEVEASKPLSQDELEQLFWLRANARQLSALRSEMRRVQESLATPSRQKREQIDALTNEMLQVAREAMQAPEQQRQP